LTALGYGAIRLRLKLAAELSTQALVGMLLRGRDDADRIPLEPVAVAAAVGYVILVALAEKRQMLRGPSWLLGAIPTLAALLVLIYTTVGRPVPGEGALSAFFVHLSHVVLTPAAVVVSLLLSWCVTRLLRVPVSAWSALMVLVFSALVLARGF
jgi:hypothetical protein